MTTTYATTNIVIHAGSRCILAEDFNVDTEERIRSSTLAIRAAHFLDTGHVRFFMDTDDGSAMRHFTMWLQEESAVVDKCWILGETLSDEERAAA